jgi:cell division protein FtsW
MPNNTPSRKIDFILFGAVTGLVVFGILILSSVSASLSVDKFGTTYYYLLHQLGSITIGLVLGFTAFKINPAILKRFALFILLGALVLMAMVFLPKIGSSAWGATRWINLGFTSLQPSEFLKLAFIIYLASWLATRTGKNKNIISQPEKKISQTFLVFILIMAIIGILLFLQSDVSTLIIIIATAIILYFLAETPLWHTATIFFSAIALLVALVPIAQYRMKRILVFLNPDVDPMGMGYQIKQAFIAIGSGGLFGVGLGMSRQKFGFLPASMSDSIFAILAEETGFFGCMVVITLFLLFLWRGFKIASSAQDNFLKLMAFGITFWILIQTLINISSMVGLFPLAGIPLPFFSYGGTAIITELIGVGILLNISQKNKTYL